jgi:ubiquinone/menaquinone biosynthesis C-methylase UbiE
MKADHEFRHGWVVRAYLWATRLLYGPFAWAYDAVAWLVSFGYWSRWRLDTLGYLQAGKVLETGFGTGELLVALVEEGFDVTGLEPSPQMLKVTDRKLRRKKLLIKRVRGKTEAIPFMADRFDNVLSTFPSNYILGARTLREINRVMDRNGRWVVVGMGVRFKSGIRGFIVNLWMGRYVDVFIRQFVEFAESTGFKARRVDHQTDAYTLPVLIMEKRDGT